MRTCLALVAVLLAACAVTGVAQAAQPGPADIAYRLTLTDRADGTLTGTERIAFVNDAAVAQADLWLRLWGNGPGGCAQPAVRVEVLHGARPDAPAVGCTALRLALDRPVAPGATGAVVLRIEVKLPAADARLGRQGDVHLYGNALPTVAPIVEGVPDLGPYLALGDPFVTASARWSVRLTHRTSVVAATTGRTLRRMVVGHGWTTEHLAAPAARDFMIATGPWQVRTEQVGGVRVRLLAARDVRAAPALLATAARAVRTFQRWLGAMGGTGLDVVITPGLESQGMEYPGVVLSEPGAETVVHEVAHQWFSVLVGSDGARQPWLDETPTTYVQLEERVDLDGCDRGDPLGDYGTARLDWTLGRFAQHPAWYDAVYVGGACAFSALAHDWGRPRVLAMLRGYVAAEQGQIATRDDLVTAIRSAAPAGYDVDAWLRLARLA